MRGVHDSASLQRQCWSEAIMTAIRRLPLFVVGVIAGMSGMVGGAAAQNYPWCAQLGGGMGGAMNCGFVSFDQCMETARGAGGFCMLNNLYRPPVAVAPGGRRAGKPHRRKTP